MPIQKADPKVRENLVQSEVDRAVELCQEAENSGQKSIFFTTDRDIYQEVRQILDEEHDIIVPMMVYCGVNAPPSRLQIEHYGDQTEMKLKWKTS